MPDIINLPNGEFTWTNTDYNLHGQHYKMKGSMGFVHYYLMTREAMTLFFKRKNINA